MPAILLLGESYQREKKKEKVISEWQKELEDPKFYRLEAGDLSSQEFNQHLKSDSLFSKTKIIHLTHLEEAEETDKFASAIDGSKLQSIGLILESDSLRKNSSLYKKMEKRGKVEEFEEVDGKNFPKFLKKFADRKGLSLDPEAKKWMTRVMEPNLVRLDRELEKLVGLEKDSVSLRDVREVVWTAGRGDLFDFLDAFSDGELSESLGQLKALLDSGEEEGKVFYMLARELRMLISAKDLAERGLSKKEMASKMGTYHWLAGKKRSQAEGFSCRELFDLLKGLKEKDELVKTGKSKYKDVLLDLVFESAGGE